MTTTTKHRIRDHIIGAAVTATATLVLTFATGVWNSRESVASHKADMQEINAKLERVLDLLCEQKSGARACVVPADVTKVAQR